MAEAPRPGTRALPRLPQVTPAALADLVRSAAVDVLTSRDLDPAALPAEVTIERPRNPEHGDYATNLALRSAKKAGVPPADLAGWLETSGVRHVVYSSCNAQSLARDLALMPSLRPVEARVLDMFPHTTHYEVMVLLAR